MTNEEAIEILKTADFPEDYTVEEVQQALDMAIQALGQTDGDLISRETVKYYIKSHIHEIITESGIDKNEHTNRILRALVSGIETMPSAEKTASWVELDDYPNEDWECDNCGYIIAGVEEPYRFCPNCGKKMWK